MTRPTATSIEDWPTLAQQQADALAQLLDEGAGSTPIEVVLQKVSHRGQTSLPASLRRRWGLTDGGVVGVIDLGDAALIVPGGSTPLGVSCDRCSEIATRTASTRSTTRIWRISSCEACAD